MNNMLSSQQIDDFYNNCIDQKSKIFEKTVTLQEYLEQKDQYYNMALEYYERIYKLDQSCWFLIVQKISTLVQVPLKLGIQQTWNKYYDEILLILEACQDFTLFKEFINEGFETILDRFPEKDQSFVIQKFIQLLNFIFQQEESQHSFVELGCIFELMGDKVKHVDNKYLYDKSLSCFDKAINIRKPYSVVINYKCKKNFSSSEPSIYLQKNYLYIKIKIKSKTLSIVKRYIQLECIESVRKKCYNLLIDTSNYREALLVGRLAHRMRDISCIQNIQRNL